MKTETNDLVATLLLPDLLPPDLLPEGPHLLQPDQYKSLHRIVTEAQQQSIISASLESAVLKWFHGENAPLENCAAELGYRLDSGKATVAGRVMRADPVYQQMDINNAVLGDRSLIDLTNEESETIIQDLNKHFSEDGLRFESGSEGRWYCVFEQNLTLQTIPPGYATGRDVSLQMPTGDGARRWRGWLAEIEMLLYAHPVNAARAATGKTVANSLWLWGEGALQTLPPLDSADRQIIAECFYTRSLADFYGLPCGGLENFQHVSVDKPVLVVDGRLAAARATGNQNRYEALLEMLDQQVFTHLENGLRRGGWECARIWLGGDRWLLCGQRSLIGSIKSKLYSVFSRTGQSRA